MLIPFTCKIILNENKILNKLWNTKASLGIIRNETNFTITAVRHCDCQVKIHCRFGRSPHKTVSKHYVVKWTVWNNISTIALVRKPKPIHSIWWSGGTIQRRFMQTPQETIFLLVAIAESLGMFFKHTLQWPGKITTRPQKNKYVLSFCAALW